MALTKVTYSMIEGAVVSAESLGADPTGVSDSAAAIQAGIDAGKVVVCTPGRYLIETDIVLKSGARLLGQPGATIYRNTDVRFTGIFPGLSQLTAVADMDYGSNLIELSAGSYASVTVGDYLYVKNEVSANTDYILDFVAASTTDLLSPSEWVYQVQVFKVIEKLGASNKVRVNAAAHVDFPLTGAGFIYLVGGDVVEDVVIEGLTFENGSGLSTSSAEAAFFNVNYAYNINIVNNIFNLWGYTGGIYCRFGQYHISGNDFNLPKQLGIFLRQAVPDSTLTNNTFRKQTTGDASIFIEAHNYNITISGNNFDGARSQELSDSAQLISAIQMDAKVNNVSIIGNNVNGYGVGIRMELGCMFNTISGNTIENCDISGLRLVQSGQNTFSGNTFYNCGLATSPGILTNAQGGIFASSTARNVFTGNQIVYDAAKGKTAFYLFGSDDVFVDNVIINATDSIVSGSSNRIAGNLFKSSLATSQILKITGSSAHYNVIEDNQFVSDTSCLYGVRIDDGSECNVVRRNVSSNCDFTVALTTTSNAQSLYENTRMSASNTATVNVYNVEISAPVMPSNAGMPRRFRIYSTTTAAGAGALSPQGNIWWEYAQNVTALNYFVKFEITTSLVSI